MSDKIIVPESYKGYIVTLNTLARSFPDTREDITLYCDYIHKTVEGAEYSAQNQGKSSVSHHLQAHVTYGDFDRITFNGTNRFPRFFDLDQRSKYWLGKHQSIFLYQIDFENTSPRLFPYVDNSTKALDNDFGFCVFGKERNVIHSALRGEVYSYNKQDDTHIKEGQICPFFLLSQISFSNDILTRVKDFSGFIRDIRLKIIEKLDEIIERNKLEVNYEIYGCLNTSEISILWLASQYTDIFALIDILKGAKFLVKDGENKKECDVFLTFYSVLGRALTNKIWSSNDIRKKLDECEGMAQVDIALSNEKSIKEFYQLLVKDIDEEKILNGIRFGEHDLSLVIPFKYIYDANCETPKESEISKESEAQKETEVPEDSVSQNSTGIKGLFKNDEIIKYILGIKVTPLSEDINSERYDKKDFVLSFDESLVDNEGIITQFNELHDELKLDYESKGDGVNCIIRELYDLIRDKMKGSFNSHAGAVDTLDMLFTDYLSNIHASYNALWRNDYHYQFKKSLEYLKFILLEENQNFWDLFTQTINNIRQQTEHFAQSGRLVMQIPASHLRYTACCDMMLHSYYGAIKTVLEDVYSKQRKFIKNPYQSELLPIITTNSTPAIRSVLYVAGKKCDDLRILQIDIPYSLLFDPIVGFPYLIHELFHFITPEDRINRNKQLFSIAVNEALCSFYVDRFESIFHNYYFETQFMDGPLDGISLDNKLEEFERFLGKASNSKDLKPDLIKLFKNNLSKFMFNDGVIAKIRERIVDEIIKNGNDDYNNAAWNKAKLIFEKCVKSISIQELDTIADRILEGMSSVEMLKIKGDEKGLNQLYYNNKYIGFSVKADTESTNEGNKSIKEVSDYLFANRGSVFSTYYLYLNLYVGYWRIQSKLDDHFFAGIREAIPDYAMVKYCKMSDIDYLICYTRKLRDNSNKTLNDEKVNAIIGQNEIVRLFSVLIWMSNSVSYQNNGFKRFNFEDNSKAFIRQYMAEYMPQKYSKDKIIEYIAEAVYFYCKYCACLQGFKRDYGAYFSAIKNYGRNYDVYFKFDYSNKNPTLDSLVRIVRKQRRNKQIRDHLIKSNYWSTIDSLCQESIDKYNKGDFMPSYTEIRKSLKKLELLDLEGKQYEEIMTHYNKLAFENELCFVHTSIRQKTFKMISDNKTKSNNENIARKKKEALYKESYGIEDYEKHTTYRIWDLQQMFDIIDWIHGYFGGISDNTDAWYCVRHKKEKLYPSALGIKKNAKDNNSFKCIYRYIQKDLHLYYREKGTDLGGICEHEAIAKMTIDDSKRVSNLIGFKRSLINCINDDVFCENPDNISLYLFSDSKYLEARRWLIGQRDFLKAKRKAYGDYINTPLVFGSGSEIEEFSKYAIGRNTEKEVVQYEKRVGGSIKLRSIEKTELLPMTLSFTNFNQDGCFLAYDFRTPIETKIDEYSLNDIQYMYIAELCKKNKGNESIKRIIREHAFLYRLDIGFDTIRHLKRLES